MRPLPWELPLRPAVWWEVWWSSATAEEEVVEEEEVEHVRPHASEASASCRSTSRESTLAPRRRSQ